MRTLLILLFLNFIITIANADSKIEIISDTTLVEIDSSRFMTIEDITVPLPSKEFIFLHQKEKEITSAGTWSNGVYIGGSSLKISKYSFSLGENGKKEKISFFGSNLANAINTSPKAFRLMKSYKTKKITGLGIWLVGLGLLANSFNQPEDNSVSKEGVLFSVGIMYLGSFFASPSKKVFEKSVDIESI